jgi:asparagine synthase (glutamine-hydrolysing)
LCGILGIWARNQKGQNDFLKLPHALKKIQHRGPDFQSSKFCSNVAFGHARLSIVDLSTAANQPFTDTTGKHHLIFNGEIYNHAELRKKATENGVNFNTVSDTEVLLNLLIEKGEKALDDLNGFFAFVYYNEEKNEIISARDRMGIKPLLYAETNDAVYFSSELKPLLDFDINREIDQTALENYFAYTYIPAPLTIFKSVKKMLPGEWIKISNGVVQKGTYFSLNEKPAFEGSFENAKTQLADLLNQSVKLRLLADVPVGCFLSGGLDSSIISAIAKEQKNDLNTFSVGFDHPYFNESDFAEQMAAHIGSKHHRIQFNKNQFTQVIPDFLNSLDEPFADSSSIAVYLLSQETKKEVTVALSGDGADELFGGYRKHLAETKIRNTGSLKKRMINSAAGILPQPSDSRGGKWSDLQRKIKKFAAGLKLTNEERFEFYCRWISSADEGRLINNFGSSKYLVEKIDSMNDYLMNDQRMVLPNDMLKKVDSMSMAHGLEVRVPFLDHNLVHFANSLPADWKVNSTKTKLILRESFKQLLPDDILHRSKKGFEIPLNTWLHEIIDDYFSSACFSQSYIARQNLFNYSFIEELKNLWKSGRAGERIYLIWSLLVFQHWYHLNLEQK